MKIFTFMWFIQNYGYCWHKIGEKLQSPTFFVEMMQQTSWNLQLFPRGEEDPDSMSLYLKRSDTCNGPKKIAFNYELSVFDVNGKVLESAEIEEDYFEFEKRESFGLADFFERPKNNLGQKCNDLFLDIIRVCCTMWIGEGEVVKEDFSCARTQIGLQKVSFNITIENFGTHKPFEKRPFNVGSVSKDGLKVSGKVYVKSEPSLEDKIMVEIIPNSDNSPSITCQIYFLSSDGKEVECDKINITNYSGKIRTFSFPINLGNHLLDKKLGYLSDDSLTIRCECTLSTGIEFETMEKTFYDLHLTPCLRKKLQYSSITSNSAGAKNFLADIKSLYIEILSDVQLKTRTKKFPAHTFVLRARSLVLNTMLITDMKEKNMNCIQVDDLDDGTIDQFLLFLYSDVIEDLQWESVMKLYYAADKYQVQRLKDVCSSFLISTLDICNFVDLLILAHIHQDSDLKTTVEKFICCKNKEIFCTDAWDNIMETYPQLAMKTMHYYLKNSKDPKHYLK